METTLTQSNAVELVCWKVWGGNNRADIELSIPGFKGALHSNPYKGAKGGDLYYMSACGSGAISRLCLADVSGHGESMAPVSQWFEKAFSKQIHLENPTDVMAAVNEKAVSSSFHGFSTAICASYNSLNGDFHYCYGGHPYIEIYRNGSDHWEELSYATPDSGELWNLPLGVSAEVKYAIGKTKLRPGDRLVFFTDGLIEAQNREGKLLGEAIWDSLPRSDTASDQLASILQVVQQHVGDLETLNDDLTLIVFDVEPFQRGNKYSLLVYNQVWRKVKTWWQHWKSNTN